MKRVYFLYIVLFSIGIISCSASKYTPVPLKTGNYSFTMSDSSGNKLIDGSIKLDTNSMGKISGTYSITKKYVTDFPGLSTMTGNCEGTYEKSEGMIHLNMNPKLADANVFIGAKIYRTSLAGEWSFSTFRSLNRAKGSFVASYTD
jgi:hypothetical protein